MGAIKCNTLVIKVASRCNLNCTYCYMYNMGDGTYRNQPKTMLPDTVENLLDRIFEHSLENKIDKFNFVFHGGEPLLAGKQFFIDFVNRAKSRLNPFVDAHFVIQTNAVLLDDDWCQLFLDLNIHLGISLDGTEKINDMFRIDHAGKGSYSKIVDGLKIAQKEKYKKNYPGILSVININSDPVEVYNHFKQLKIFSVDFLLPEANHNTLPPAQEPGILPVYTSYGDWLIDLFDVWFNDNEVNRIDRIHIFSHIIHLILGGEVFADNIGMSDNQVLVIETDGGIEAVDALKICGEGFTKAGATVFNTSFEQALRTDLAFLYYRSSYFLSNKCNSCPVKEICGGGYLPHRYNKENGFNNESIYCEDMLKIITHIQNRIIMEIPDLILKETKSEILTYEDALSLLSDNEKNLPRSLQNEDIKFLETFKVS